MTRAYRAILARAWYAADCPPWDAGRRFPVARAILPAMARSMARRVRRCAR